MCKKQTKLYGGREKNTAAARNSRVGEIEAGLHSESFGFVGTKKRAKKGRQRRKHERVYKVLLEQGRRAKKRGAVGYGGGTTLLGALGKKAGRKIEMKQGEQFGVGKSI